MELRWRGECLDGLSIRGLRGLPAESFETLSRGAIVTVALTGGDSLTREVESSIPRVSESDRERGVHDRTPNALNKNRDFCLAQDSTQIPLWPREIEKPRGGGSPGFLANPLAVLRSLRALTLGDIAP